MKLFLYCTVIAACGGIGFLKCDTYRQRKYLLLDYVGFLKLLKAELCFSYASAPEILEKIGDEGDSPAFRLAKETARIYAESDRELSAAFEEIFHRIYDKSALNNYDKSIMKEMSKYLGRFAIEGQSELFERMDSRLAIQLAEASDMLETKGRAYKSLGIFVGIAIVILLI